MNWILRDRSWIRRGLMKVLEVGLELGDLEALIMDF